MANLQLLDAENKLKGENIVTSNFVIEAVLGKNVCSTGKDRLCVSLNYIDKAIQGHGQYDLHFAAFVCNKLKFVPVLHYFAFCNDALEFNSKYAE